MEFDSPSGFGLSFLSTRTVANVPKELALCNRDPRVRILHDQEAGAVSSTVVGRVKVIYIVTLGWIIYGHKAADGKVIGLLLATIGIIPQVLAKFLRSLGTLIGFLCELALWLDGSYSPSIHRYTLITLKNKPV